MSENVPAVLNWVEVRAECTVDAAFAQLKREVQEDVREMQALMETSARRKFTFDDSGASRFSVLRKDVFPVPTERSVDFAIEKGQIVVIGIDNKVALTATVVLNDEGQCRLSVGGKELQHWQLRRAVLERLFFGT